ncbi:hypothetical protein BC829DRAFT_390068 [Chytridium lagenaria]|nr:hypothetical protein BC829DRAFT_390068 [Chytridium lagenaria]
MIILVIIGSWTVNGAPLKTGAESVYQVLFADTLSSEPQLPLPPPKQETIASSVLSIPVQLLPSPEVPPLIPRPVQRSDLNPPIAPSLPPPHRPQPESGPAGAPAVQPVGPFVNTDSENNTPPPPPEVISAIPAPQFPISSDFAVIKPEPSTTISPARTVISNLEGNGGLLPTLSSTPANVGDSISSGSTQQSQSSPSSVSSNHTAIIAGTISAVAFLLILIISLVIYIRHRRSQSKDISDARQRAFFQANLVRTPSNASKISIPLCDAPKGKNSVYRPKLRLTGVEGVEDPFVTDAEVKVGKDSGGFARSSGNVSSVFSKRG